MCCRGLCVKGLTNGQALGTSASTTLFCGGRRVACIFLENPTARSGRRSAASLPLLGRDCGVNLFQDLVQAVTEFPLRIVLLKFPHVAHPPNVIADAISLFVIPGQFSAADLFTQIDRLEHRTIAVPASAHVVNLSRPRRRNEFSK